MLQQISPVQIFRKSEKKEKVKKRLREKWRKREGIKSGGDVMVAPESFLQSPLEYSDSQVGQICGYLNPMTQTVNEQDRIFYKPEKHLRFAGKI